VERVYEYNKTAYQNKVIMINIFLILILGYCLFKIIFAGTNIYLWIFAAVICIYALVNSFIRKGNPRKIIITDDEIVFSSFGEKRFEINKLTKFRLKVSTPNYQVIIRLEDSDKRTGSFWVTYSQFNDKMDLIAEFDFLEKKIHPDSLRFRGRSGKGDKRPDPPGSIDMPNTV